MTNEPNTTADREAFEAWMKRSEFLELDCFDLSPRGAYSNGATQLQWDAWQASRAQAAQPCGHPASMLMKSAETGEPLYCEACDDKSARRDAERREAELIVEVSALKQAAQAVPEVWRPMETAPKDGTLLRLLVEFEHHATEDGEGPQPTIGSNTWDNHHDFDEWQFAGWDWEQDCYTQGVGRPVGWLPILAAPTTQAAPQPTAQRGTALVDAARFASDVLAEIYAKCQIKIGPFASQAQLANVQLRDALKALATQPQEAAPAAVPEGWVPCMIDYEGGYPEEVAFGPQIMMDRLKKWLTSYFAMLAAQPAEGVQASALASEAEALADAFPLAGKDADVFRWAMDAESMLRRLIVTQPTGVPAQGDDLSCVKHLIEVVRMPNAEYEADAHNAAVRKLRAIAQAKESGS